MNSLIGEDDERGSGRLRATVVDTEDGSRSIVILCNAQLEQNLEVDYTGEGVDFDRILRSLVSHLDLVGQWAIERLTPVNQILT